MDSTALRSLCLGQATALILLAATQGCAHAPAAGAAVPVSAACTARARVLRIGPPTSLTQDAGSNTYLVGTLTSLLPADFQTREGAPAIELRSQTGSDAFLARYDADGQVVWARAIADAGEPRVGQEHVPTGVAVTPGGTLAVAGRLLGAVTVGEKALVSPAGAAFLAGVSAESGRGLWAVKADLGKTGAFRAVAASQRSKLDRVAVCGQAGVAARDLVEGASFGGQTDLVLAMFDGQGHRLWSAQVAAPGMENCSALALGDDGDVFAAGWFDDDSLTFPGPGPVTVAGPGTAVRKSIWVARFAGDGDGAGGARTLAAAAYGGTFGAALPNALAVAPGGGLLVGGQFTGDLVVGRSLAAVGQDDGFIARLDARTLAPAWAERIGGGAVDQVRGLAVTPAGEAVATGIFGPSNRAIRASSGGADTSGAAGLRSEGSISLFVLGLDAATGATRSASVPSGPGEHAGDAVAVNPAGGDQIAILGTLSGAATFGPAGRVETPDFLDAVLLLSRGCGGADLAQLAAQEVR